LALGVRAPRQAGDFIDGGGIPGNCGCSCELIGEHAFSFGIKSRRRARTIWGEDTKVHGLSGLHEQTTNTSSKSVRFWPENLIF